MPIIYYNNKCKFCGKTYTGFGKKFCSTKCRDKNIVKQHWDKFGDRKV